MHNIKDIRNNFENFKNQIKDRNFDANLDDLAKLDKENRNLIIVPRETPLSSIHLENMTKLANLGVKIIPPMPAFYLKPNSVDEIIDYFVEKILIVSGGVSNYDSKFIYSPEEILPDIYDEK